jgi:hypothetical protein
MQPNDVPAIECQQCAILCDCEIKDFFIGRSLIGVTRFRGREHVVSKGPQSLDDGKAEILVRIEVSHASGVLVRLNRLFYLFAMISIILPSDTQIIFGEIRVMLEDTRVAETLPLPLHEACNGMARAANTRIASANAR